MTEPTSTDVDAFLAANALRLRVELCDFLRIPSVSALPEHAADVRRAAVWFSDTLRRVGLDAELLETPGHPVVLGEWRGAGPAAPTVLVYGHYDVQPAEPDDHWVSPPFEPSEREGRLYARGATDDKGQLYLHVAALEALLTTRGTLPVNVVVLAEGEEEIGSPHLAAVLAMHDTRFGADVAVISDSPMFAPGVPALCVATRGHLGVQIDVAGPATPGRGSRPYCRRARRPR